MLDNYRRKKRINEISLGFKGIAAALLLITLLTTIYRLAVASFQRRMARDDEARGISFSTSAISKKAARKGRTVEGMAEGWLDMEFDEEEEKNLGMKLFIYLLCLICTVYYFSLFF